MGSFALKESLIKKYPRKSLNIRLILVTHKGRCHKYGKPGHWKAECAKKRPRNPRHVPSAIRENIGKRTVPSSRERGCHPRLKLFLMTKDT
jgi:hypothetical protein